MHEIQAVMNLNEIRISGKFKIAKVYGQTYGKLPFEQNAGTAYLNISSAFQHMVASTFSHINLPTKYFP